MSLGFFNLSRWTTIHASREPDTERRLIDAAIRGDAPAFDALVRIYEPTLRAFLARRVGPQGVDDVLQETLVAAWLALERFGHRSRFKVWLYGIAVHKCADYQRARHRGVREVAYSSEVDALGCDQREYGDAELRETVLRLLSEVPPVQREVLELYYYGDFTLAEIGEILERNVNTVKYQFYRAHAILEKAWTQDDTTEGSPATTPAAVVVGAGR